MWHPLLRAIGRADLMGDPRYETAEARWQRKAEIDALVEAWTPERSKHEVMKILAGAGVPCGACPRHRRSAGRPAPDERDMIVEVEHPVRGPYITVGNPVKLSASPTKIGVGSAPRPAPPRDPGRAGLRGGATSTPSGAKARSSLAIASSTTSWSPARLRGEPYPL